MRKTTLFKWLGAAALLFASAAPANADVLVATNSTPEIGTEVTPSELTKIVITFKTVSNMTNDMQNAFADAVTLTSSGDPQNALHPSEWRLKYNSSFSNKDTNNAPNLPFNSQPTKSLALLFPDASNLAPGTITLTIPAGAMRVQYNTTNAEYAPTWTIAASNPFDAITATTVTPEAGEQTSLQEFTVEYTGFSGELAADSSVAVTLVNKDDASVNFTTTDVTVNSTNTGFTVKFAETITTPGNYTLTIPEGTVVSGTNKSPAITRDYKILSDDPFNASYTLTPASGFTPTSLSTFNVVYPNATASFITTVAKATEATLSDGTNTYNATGVTINEDGKGFTVTFDEIKKAGNYTLSIPEGTVTDGTNGNALIQATYFINNPFDSYQITPQSGTTNSSLKEFVVSFPSFTGTLNVTEGQNAATLDGVSSTSIALNSDGKGFTVTFPEVTKAGTYSLVIPAGTVSDGVNSSTPISGTYYIADPFANPTITPADGKHLNTILEVSVTFENAFPEGTTLGDASTVTLTGDDGVSVTAVRVSEYEDRTGYDVIFDQISNDGTYTVNIPAGFLKYVDNASAALQATYTIQKPTGVFANFTSEPAAGNWIPTATWSYIYVDFPDIPSDDVTGVGNIPATFSGIGTTPDLDVTGYSLTPNKDNQDGHLRLKYMYFNSSYINLNQLDGFYELTIPEGTFTYTTAARASERSPEIIIPYTIGNIATGIESVEASEDTVNVYDLTGRQLLKDADASELRTLANGLYIVNGKKVLLRR